MAHNGTPDNQTSSTAAQQQASGRSIFWALATIVLNAMLQPSCTGYICSGDIFRDSLWPHRSSPVVCVADAIADMWIVVEKRRRPELYSERPTPAKPITVAMRLAIFTLGVLPQAVKLFSTGGIPGTQAVAAMFLLSSLASMIRTVHQEASLDDLVRLADREGANPAANKVTKDLLSFVQQATHAVGICYVWSHVLPKSGIAMSEDVFNSLTWVSTVTVWIWILYIMQHFLCMIVRGNWLLPRSAPLFIIGLFDAPGLAVEMFAQPGSKAKLSRTGVNRWQHPLALTLFAALCSYALASVLEICTTKLLGWLSSRKRPLVHAEGDLPMNVLDANDAATAAAAGPGDASGADVATIASPTDNTSDGFGQLQGTQTDADARQGAEPSPPVALSDHASSARTSDSDLASVSPNAVHRTVATGSDAQASSQGDGTSNDDVSLPLPLRIALYPFVIVLLILRYAGILEVGNSEDEQQESAEEGTARQSNERRPFQPSNGSTTEPKRHPLLVWLATPFAISDRAFRFLVRCICLLIWRINLAVISLYEHAWRWVQWKLKPHMKDRVWVAFGITNIMMAMVYYLVVFETDGTFAPSWTSLLG